MRERLTPYQSEDPSPTIPIHRMKKDRGKSVRVERGVSSYANKNAFAVLLKPASPSPSNMELPRLFHRDTDRRIKGKRY